MAKKLEHDRILALCNTIAKIVFKEHNGKLSQHYDCLLERMKEVGAVDIGEELIEDVAALVTIGLETRGHLTDEMLETLEEKLAALLRLLGTIKFNK